MKKIIARLRQEDAKIIVKNSLTASHNIVANHGKFIDNLFIKIGIIKHV